MELRIKTFDELTARELYEILRPRSEIFIIEQQGCYQDLDGIDYKSTHIFLVDDTGAAAGCIRVFPKEDEPGMVQLGRLVSRDRMQGLGRQLMEESEIVAASRYGGKQLFLTGRRSARGFCKKCGYRAEGPEDFTDDTAPYYLFRKACNAR